MVLTKEKKKIDEWNGNRNNFPMKLTFKQKGGGDQGIGIVLNNQNKETLLKLQGREIFFILETIQPNEKDDFEDNVHNTRKTPPPQKALGMRAGDLGAFRHRHSTLILLEEVVRVRAFLLPASVLPTCKKHACR